jgi:hypothetical protein
MDKKTNHFSAIRSAQQIARQNKELREEIHQPLDDEGDKKSKN